MGTKVWFRFWAMLSEHVLTFLISRPARANPDVSTDSLASGFQTLESLQQNGFDDVEAQICYLYPKFCPKPFFELIKCRLPGRLTSDKSEAALSLFPGYSL